jgi:osmotically-inducible protein OsmY
MNKASRILSVLFLALPLGIVAGCASTDTRERQPVGEYIDDSVITAKVKTAIAADPDVSVMEVSVETYDGVVQLSGFVSNQAQANRAVEIARGVSGVKGVRNDMRIR